MGDIKLGIKLDFDGKAVTGGVVVARDDFRKLAAEAKAAGDATASGFSSAAKGVRSISEQLANVQTAVAGYFSVSQAYAGAKWIVEQSSAMQQLEARLKVATANAAEYAKASDGVFQVANRWGAAVDQTAGAFTRLNPVITQMGGSSSTTLKMLDGMAASLRLSGASATETSAVLLQFSQAMGSGRVGGDEFRSMMENAEPLMRAVAAQMGKTTAELRQMSEEVKLTSSVFGNALLPAIDKLAAQAESIPLGVSQALQVLKNNLQKDFGKEFEESSKKVSAAILAVSEHTPEMASAIRSLNNGLVTLAEKAALVAGGAALGAVVLSAGSATTAMTGLAAGIKAVNAEAALFATGAALQRLETLSMAGKAGLVGMALWGGYEVGSLIADIGAVQDAVGRLLEPIFRAYEKAFGEKSAQARIAAEDAAKALDDLKKKKASGQTHVTLDTEVLGLSSKKTQGIDQAILDAEKTAERLQSAYESIIFAPAKAAEKVGSSSRLSAANEYGALVKDLKWREKIVSEYDTKLLNLQQSFADKMAATPAAKKGDLLRNHQAALAAMLEERKNALESLPDFKEAKAATDARADALVKSYQASVKRALEILKQDHEQYRLPTENFIQASAIYESSAIQAQIAALKAKLSAATKDSERITIRANIDELQKDLAQIPLRTNAALEDAESKSQEIINRMMVDAGKQLDPLAEKGREFAQKWGSAMQAAARDGNQAMIDAGSAVWKSWADQAQFESVKQQYDALFSEMQRQIEEVRQLAAKDGGFLSGMAAEATVQAIHDRTIPTLNELLAKMREFKGDSPVNEKTVTEAVRATQKVVNEVNPVWQRFSDDIRRSLTDDIYRGLEQGGKKGATVAYESIVRTLKAIPIKLLVETLISPVFSGVNSMFGGSNAPAQNTGVGLLGSASSLYNAYSSWSNAGGIGGLGTAAGNWFGQAFGDAAYAANSGAYAQGFSAGLYGGQGMAAEYSKYALEMSNAGNYAAAGAYQQAADAAGKGASQGGGLSSGLGYAAAFYALTQEKYGQAVGTAIGTYIMPGIGTVIGSTLGSLVDSFTSSGGAPKSMVGGGGRVTSSGVVYDPTGQAHWTDYTEQSKSLASAILTEQLVGALRKINAGYAGGGAYVKGELNLKGSSSNQTVAQATSSSGQVIYHRYTEAGKGTEDFQKFVAEEIPRLQLALVVDAMRTAGGEIQKIANSVVGTSADLTDVLSGMDSNAIAAATASLSGLVDILEKIKHGIDASITGDAVARIAGFAGGVGNLAAQVASYENNYLSAAERAARQHDEMAAVFARLNLQMPGSKAGFRNLAESLDKTHESGQKAFAAMMGMESAFAAWADTVEGKTRTLADAQDALRQAYDKQSTEMQATVDKFGGYAKSMRDFRASLLTGSLSPLDARGRYAEAKNQFDSIRTRAALGDTAAIESLQSASSAFLEASRAMFASGNAYAADFASVIGAVEGTESLASRQARVAESQLATLKDQVSALVTLNESVLSVKDALSQVTLASLQESARGAVSGPTLSGMYRDILGRDADAGGLAYWTQQSQTMTGGELMRAFLGASTQPGNSDSTSAIAWARKMGIPGYASGGIASGTFLAGETGPEIIHSPVPVRVLPNAVTRGYFGGGQTDASPELLAELKALRLEVAALRKEQAKQTGDLIGAGFAAQGQVADKLADALRDGRREPARMSA